MKLLVNGGDVDIDDRHAKTPLLWVLRDVLGLHGTKFGCGAGWCAACTVLIDGRNMKACQTTTEQAVGKTVTTVEGASGAVVDAVRSAWHQANVVQCVTASLVRRWPRWRCWSRTRPPTTRGSTRG
jgi:aerobic-type carbon monoxide dehydrogenase small subunit (CoxS/CutS family)